jgi:signal peptidase
MDKTKVKVGSVVINVLAILICIVLALVVASAIGSIGKDYVNFFGSATFAVKTNSMEWNEDYNPTYPAEYKKTSFKKGNLLFCKVLKTQEERSSLDVGDVIIFHRTEQGVPILVTHRIVEVHDMGANGIFYTTKGDNNIGTDTQQVYSEEVIGLYSGARIGGLGAVVLFVQTPLGFGLVVFLPSVLLLVYCGIMLFKNLKVYKTEKAVDDKERIRQELLREMGIAERDKHIEAQDDTPDTVSHDE